MKIIKFFVPVLFAGIMSVMMFSCSKSDAYMAPGGGDTSNVYKVNILATQFDPATTTMQVGYKITWTNMDSQPLYIYICYNRNLCLSLRGSPGCNRYALCGCEIKLFV
jgi:hypothetical protein